MAETRTSYVETRAKWERLYKTTQTKGPGEAHPNLSPDDEFADFEIGDKGNLDGSVAKKPEMLEFEYARSALKNGLKLEKSLGTNPTSSASPAAATRTPALPQWWRTTSSARRSPKSRAPSA